MVCFLLHTGQRGREGMCLCLFVTYRLNLTWINLDDTHAGSDQFPSQCFGKRPHGRLGGTIDTSTRVPLAAGDAADVDDVAASSVLAAILLQEDGQHRLRHVDQARHIGREHDLHVLRLDLGRLVHALDQPGIVDQDINVPELGWQVGHKGLDILRLGNVQLHRQHLHALADFLGDLGRDALQRVDSARGDDDLEAPGACTGEFLRDRLADPGTGTGHQHRLAFEAFGHGR